MTGNDGLYIMTPLVYNAGPEMRLVKVAGEKLFIWKVDILDGTPLLDIKPYVPEFDARDTDKIGWLFGKIDELPEKRDDPVKVLNIVNRTDYSRKENT